MWNPDLYLEQLYCENEPKYAFKASTKEEWAKWRTDLSAGFIESMGGFPEKAADLEPKLLEEKEFPEYIRQRVEFTVYSNMRTPAYVLIPKSSETRHRAVVACHGHGYGSKEIVGLTMEGAEQEGDPGYQKNFAVELVKRGYLVIVPELLGFGDMKLKRDEKSYSSCDPISTYLLMMGQTMAGHRVYQVLRSIDYLQQRQDVDGNRIGCMGISGGGLVCAFASAIDERIKAAVVSGFTNTFKDSVMSIRHCVDNYIPSLVRYAEMPDIIGMIAPRPLLVESGTKDPIFPIEATLKAYTKLEQIYALLGAEDRLDKDIFPADHQIWGNKAYKWFEHM